MDAASGTAAVYKIIVGPGAGFTKPLRLTKAGLSDSRMHFLYALVRKSSFSKAQGFVKPAPGVH